MASIKCKMCGGTIEVNNESVVVCKFCGLTQTVPQAKNAYEAKGWPTMTEKEKVEKALLELTEEYERMLATEDAIQNPDICWDEIQSSLDAMIDFSNPQIDRHIIRKFVSKIVPNGRNHFRWYMNLDGKDTTTLDMVTEGRKNNAVISFNDDEEDEPPLHIGDVIGLTELQQYFPNLLKNENQNGIITTVGKCGKKSSLDAILHRLQSKTKGDSSVLFRTNV